MLFYVLLGIQVILCLMLIGLVLLQQGKGADLGAAFSGASNTVFGAGGADKFVVRLTTITALLFMVNTLILVNQFSKRIAMPVAASTGGIVSELEKSAASSMVVDGNPVEVGGDKKDVPAKVDVEPKPAAK